MLDENHAKERYQVKGESGGLPLLRISSSLCSAVHSSGSEYTEDELQKLKQAAIDPQAITGHESKRTKH